MCVPDCEDISSGRLLENGKTDEQKRSLEETAKKRFVLIWIDLIDSVWINGLSEE